ncbi:rust resistance kinase lr10 [Quercus suber]|uniref:Rust resistance kinase lr10 n=1 Tax=Quercus suber TaxID=58331 RepID=A0AAW0J8X4_QUESU
MGRINHVNVVCLAGFCVDGFRRALVYEFLPNDSLENFGILLLEMVGGRKNVDDIIVENTSQIYFPE